MRTARARSAAVAAAPHANGREVLASGAPPRQEVCEQDGRRAGVQVCGATVGRCGRGESLVVEVDGETERGARVRKAAHALRLGSVLATQCQRKSDDQGTYLFFRDQIT